MTTIENFKVLNLEISVQFVKELDYFRVIVNYGKLENRYVFKHFYDANKKFIELVKQHLI